MRVIAKILFVGYITVTVLSFIFNLVLITLIKKRTAPIMKQYGVILFQVCIVNIIAGLIYGIFQYVSKLF